MIVTGQNIIGSEFSAAGNNEFYGIDPATGQPLPVAFTEATDVEIEEACRRAEAAFEIYRRKSGAERAAFLEAIADEIMALGDELIERCRQETALPAGRLTGERGRTVGQLRLFAGVLREGSWVGARIDPALPERQPLPRPDIRQMQIALGPVGIFGASNFPLAFSVAGGDTASALAAGCTIVVKGHPAHPGTSELVGRAIVAAAQRTGMPAGVFSLLQGPSPHVGMGIVKHPLIKAIGFTGSFHGGKALFDAANQRPEPIPVYAEMGSTNPVFILPGALRERAASLATGLRNSVTLGVGQFCTNPGLTILAEERSAASFLQALREEIAAAPSATMLTEGIHRSYERGLSGLRERAEVEFIAEGKREDGGGQGVPFAAKTTAAHFLKNRDLEKELFGPSTLLIAAGAREEILAIARRLEGHLTATLHGTEQDLKEYADLVAILERKVGRLIINGFPTGVEVSHAMVHGGPFPATTDARMTSVGTAAITRFTRPVCYQDFPAYLLPEALRDDNPLNIWRMVDGEWRK